MQQEVDLMELSLRWQAVDLDELGLRRELAPNGVAWRAPAAIQLEKKCAYCPCIKHPSRTCGACGCRPPKK